MNLELTYPFLPVHLRAEAARRLNVDVDSIVGLAYAELAYRDGEVLDEAAFHEAYPDDCFDEHTGAAVLPADLLVRSIDTPRDPRQRLAAPLTTEDIAAARVSDASEQVAYLQALDAPGVIVRHARRLLQEVAEEPSSGVRWQPMAELMTGPPARQGACGAPSPLFAAPSEAPSRETDPVRAALIGSGFLVQYPFATFVVAADGAVRDVFTTAALRPVGGDDAHVLLVGPGFGAEAFVRDVAARRWTEGDVPPGAPRYVAGTIPDMKWAVVVDVVAARGYRMSPSLAGSDQAGGTFNSECGLYAWDGGRFVVEARTGAPVVDARDVVGELVAFARSPVGWRFVMLVEDEDDVEVADANGGWPDRDEVDRGDGEAHDRTSAVDGRRVRIVDETGAAVRDLGPAGPGRVVALSPDGTRMLEVTRDHLRVLDADTGVLVGPRLDLRALHDVLRLPADVPLWQRLTAAYALPSAVAAATQAETRRALRDAFGDEVTDAELEDALRVAATRPAAPSALAVAVDDRSGSP